MVEKKKRKIEKNTPQQVWRKKKGGSTTKKENKAAQEIEDFLGVDHTKGEKVRFLKELTAKYEGLNVRSLCEEFGISRAYYYKKEVAKKKKVSDELIMECIREIRTLDKWMGYKKITDYLNNEYKEKLGEKISCKRVYKLLKERDELVKRTHKVWCENHTTKK